MRMTLKNRSNRTLSSPHYNWHDQTWPGSVCLLFLSLCICWLAFGFNSALVLDLPSLGQSVRFGSIYKYTSKEPRLGLHVCGRSQHNRISIISIFKLSKNANSTSPFDLLALYRALIFQHQSFFYIQIGENQLLLYQYHCYRRQI